MKSDTVVDAIARFLCDLDGVDEPSNQRWEKERENAEKILDIAQEITIEPKIFYTLRDKEGQDMRVDEYPITMLSDGTVEGLKEAARRMSSDSVYGYRGPYTVMKHIRYHKHIVESVE